MTAINKTSNYIGKSHCATDKYFKETMDEIKIYNKTCTADEIKAAYKDCADLGFGTTELTDGAVLPSKGANGSDITWTCTDSGVIKNNAIAAPAAGNAASPHA